MILVATLILNSPQEPHFYDVPVVGMTYTSLCCLIMLGDDLSRIHRKQILNEMKRLQLEDGSFASQFHDGETDLRFVKLCPIQSRLE